MRDKNKIHGIHLFPVRVKLSVFVGIFIYLCAWKRGKFADVDDIKGKPLGEVNGFRCYCIHPCVACPAYIKIFINNPLADSLEPCLGGCEEVVIKYNVLDSISFHKMLYHLYDRICTETGIPWM